MSTHIMLDLETFGTGGDAAVVSIGAVKFDPLIDGVLDSFHVVICPESAQAHGLKIDASTMLWWLSDDRRPAVQALLGHERHDLATALHGFAMWFGADSLPVWGNGATFDNVILRNAFRAASLPCPWKFWDDRCYRTLKNMAPDVKLQRLGTHHDALDDAHSQALHLQQIVARTGIRL